MQSQQEQAKKQTVAQIAQIEKEILEGYRQAQKDITRQIGDFYLDVLDGVDGADYYNTAIKFDRFSALETEITKRYSEASVAAGLGTRESSALGMSNVYYKNEYISSFFAPIKDVGISFNALPPSLLEMVVSGTTAKWEALPTVSQEEIIALFGTIDNYLASSGNTLTSLLSANRASEIVAIRRNLASGIIRGASFKETAKDVAAVIGTVTKQGATGAMASSLRIVRTESIRAMNTGAYANSQAVEEQGLEIERIWVAALDLRTRSSHQKLDGQQVGVDEPFVGVNGTAMYPGDFGIAGEDINCRCKTVDAVDGIPPTARRGVNPETGEYEIYDWQNYEQWAKANGVKTLPSGRQVAKPPIKKPSTKAPIDTSKLKTTADVENYAKSQIPSLEEVSFEGMSNDRAVRIVNQVKTMENKYGDLRIQKISTYDQNNSVFARAKYNIDRDSGNVIGSNIEFNNTGLYEGEGSVLDKMLSNGFESGASAGSTLEDIVTHEVGHVLQFNTAGNFDALYGLSDLPGDVLGKGVSKYAETNLLEAMSEGFLLYERGELVPPALMKEMADRMGLTPQ